EDVVQGPNGLIKSARPGQIIVELGSYPVRDKERHVAPLAAKGAIFLDGEVSGTPGMVSARKAVIYLAGDKEACAKAERFVRGFADSVGVATPMLDRAVELYDKFMEMGFGEKDVAAMVDVIGALPPAKGRR